MLLCSHAKQLLHTIYQPGCALPVKRQGPRVKPGQGLTPLVHAPELHTCTVHFRSCSAECDIVRSIWIALARYASHESCRVKSHTEASVRAAFSMRHSC